MSQIRIFGIDIGMDMMHIIMLPAPSFFINGGFPSEVAGMKFRYFRKIVVLSMKNIMTQLNSLKIAMQKKENNSSQE